MKNILITGIYRAQYLVIKYCFCTPIKNEERKRLLTRVEYMKCFGVGVFGFRTGDTV